MERRGYRVSPTARSDEALAIIAADPADCAVVDLKLATGDGLELVGALCRQTRGIRIVVLTAHGTLQSAVAAVKAGAADFLAKPADADTIVEVLEGYPGRRPRRCYPPPDEIEFRYLFAMFEKHHRNMSVTAREIGMHRRTLQRILRRRGIVPGLASGQRGDGTGYARRMLRVWREVLDGQAPTLAE